MRYNAFNNKKVEKPSLYHTPISPNKSDLCSYISGYVDGEGSFCVSLTKNSKYRTGWEVRPSFSVSQNKTRSQVLRLLNVFFGCGSIRPNISDNTLKYEVRSLEDLVDRIIPHFEEYPVLSGKWKDFMAFREVCFLMLDQKHRTPEGLKEIFSLISQMNPSGKRKYDPKEIKI